MNPLISELPKHKQVKHWLMTDLSSGLFNVHDRFYSEKELQDRFGVSIPTIRLSLKDLVNEGLIYREHGRGTFVAPKARKRQIMIVGRLFADKASHDFGLHGFLESFIGSTVSGIESYSPITLSSDHFLEIVPDLRFHYPNLEAVLFFRDYELLAQCEAILGKAAMPFLFYGSDTAHQELGLSMGCFYQEPRIINLGLQYLKSRFGDRIGFVYAAKNDVLLQRHQLYCDWMKAAGLEPISFEIKGKAAISREKHMLAQAHIEEMIDTCDAIFCADDWLAFYHHAAAVHKSIRIPDDLAILGVNDYPMCDLVYPTLSSIKIPLCEDGQNCLNQLVSLIEKGERPGISYSKIQLVQRMSA